MKNFYYIIFTCLLFNLTGCYTMVATNEEVINDNYSEEDNSRAVNIENSKAAVGYFEEDDYDDIRYQYAEQEEVSISEVEVNFFTAFSDALSGFISSGALNIILDLNSISGNSNSGTNTNYKSRNNSGSRNYSGRDR